MTWLCTYIEHQRSDSKFGWYVVRVGIVHTFMHILGHLDEVVQDNVQTFAEFRYGPVLDKVTVLILDPEIHRRLL